MERSARNLKEVSLVKKRGVKYLLDCIEKFVSIRVKPALLTTI